jgi:hypothetical protein
MLRETFLYDKLLLTKLIKVRNGLHVKCGLLYLPHKNRNYFALKTFGAMLAQAGIHAWALSRPTPLQGGGGGRIFSVDFQSQI